MKKLLLVSLSVATMAAVVLVDESRPVAQGQGQGIALGRPEVSRAVYHDVSRPLRDMPPLPARNTRDDFEVKQPAQGAPGSPGGQSDPAVQQFIVAPFAAATSNNFEGVGEGFVTSSGGSYNVNVAPPDTVGEAGLNNYIQWVNLSFAVFDKSGNLQYGPAAGNTLWAGFQGAGADCASRNDGDPIVQYDQVANRWVMTQFSLRSGNYLQCVAVSQTGNPLGSWYRYAFQYSEFPDYPKLSVWPTGYFITFNMFGATGSSFTGTRVCAYDREKMLAGDPSASQICYQTTSYGSFLASDLEGTTLPPGQTPPNYVVARSGNALAIFKFVPNFAAPANSTFTGPTMLAVSAYSAACSRSCIPQAGTSQKLDALGDRLMYRLSYRNLGARQSLVVNHSVVVNNVTAIRWYEIDVTGSSPALRQESTYAPGDGLHRWMGSIAMDQHGNIAMGYSISSSGMRPSIRFVGREVSDTLNNMGIETALYDGTGSQTRTLSRWGDYSTISLDPSDDCTFWYTTEYLKNSGTFNWNTRVGSFKFASCGSAATPDFTLSATQSSQTVDAGTDATYTIGVNGSGGFAGNVSFSASPFTNTATFNPATVTGTGSTTLTIPTTGVQAGTYTVTVTGTSGSGSSTLTHTTDVTLTVNAPLTPDFSVGISPSTQSVTQGTDAIYDVTVNPMNGYSGTPVLTNTGPGILSAPSFDGLNNKWTATLTVATGSLATTSYNLTVTATDSADSNLTHSASATLTVNPPATADFSISASPGARNVKAGQTTTYSVTITASGGFTGDVTVDIPDLPTGATCPPVKILGGSGSATLDVSTGSAAKGSYTLTITGTADLGGGNLITHSTTVSLRIR